MEVFQETVDFSVTDIGAVEEGRKVEETEPRDELEVESTNEFLLL